MFSNFLLAERRDIETRNHQVHSGASRLLVHCCFIIIALKHDPSVVGASHHGLLNGPRFKDLCTGIRDLVKAPPVQRLYGSMSCQIIH